MATPEPRSEFEGTLSSLRQHLSQFQETVRLLREALDSAERKTSFYERFDWEISEAVEGALEDSQAIRAKAMADAEAMLAQAREESAQILAAAHYIRERCQRIYERAEAAHDAAESQAERLRAEAEEEARALRTHALDERDTILSQAAAERTALLARAEAEREEIRSAIAMLREQRERARQELEDLYAAQLQTVRQRWPADQIARPTAQPAPPTGEPERVSARHRWIRRVALVLLLLVIVAGLAFLVGWRYNAWLP